MRNKLFNREWFVIFLIGGVIASLGAISWISSQGVKVRKINIKTLSSSPRAGLVETKNIISTKRNAKKSNPNQPNSSVRSRKKT